MTLTPILEGRWGRRVVVCGTSVSDVPATYAISGLLQHEFPVIGKVSNAYLFQQKSYVNV